MAMPLLGLDLSINFCQCSDIYPVAGLIYCGICKPSATAAAAVAAKNTKPALQRAGSDSG